MALSFPFIDDIAGNTNPNGLFSFPANTMTASSSHQVYDTSVNIGIPFTAEEANEDEANGFGGVSGHNGLITTPDIPIAMWRGNQFDQFGAFGTERFHENMFAGQWIMCLTSKRGASAPEEGNILLNLRQANTIIEQVYNSMEAYLHDKDVIQDGVPGHLSPEVVKALKEMPSHTWDSIPAYRKVKTSEHSVNLLSWRSVKEIADMWNSVGVQNGEVYSEANLTAGQVSFGVKGRVNDAENIFGVEVLPNMDLGLILKRKVDEDGNWGAPHFHPWAGYGNPTDDEMNYVDFGNSIERGFFIYLGSVIRRDDRPLSETDYKVHSGFSSPKPGQLFKKAMDDKLVALVSPPPGVVLRYRP